MAVERGGRGGQGSPCVGQSIEQTGLRTVTKVTLFRVVRGQEVFDKPTPHFVLLADDVLYFAGTVSDMTAVFAMQGLVPDTDQVEKIVGRLRSRCVVQVVISNSSSLTTRAVRDIRFRHKVGGRALICACGRALISAPHARHQVFWGIANAVHVAGVESRSVRGGAGARHDGCVMRGLPRRSTTLPSSRFIATASACRARSPTWCYSPAIPCYSKRRGRL